MTSIGIAADGLNARQTGDLGKAVEESGLDSLWIQEAGGGLGRQAGTRDRASFVLAQSALAATSMVTVGIGITSPFARHPAALAMTAASLAEAYGERLILGLGVGRAPDSLESPLGAMREALTISRTLLGGRKIDMAGEVFQAATSLDFDFPRGVPVYLGAIGPRMVDLACTHSDGVIISTRATWCLPYTRFVLERARKHGIAAVGFLNLYLTAPDRPSAPEQLALDSIQQIKPSRFVLSFADPGAQRLLDIHALLHEGRRPEAAAMLDRDLLKRIWIFGSPDECAQGVLPYTRLGLDTLILFLHNEDPVRQTGRLAGALRRVQSG